MNYWCNSKFPGLERQNTYSGSGYPRHFSSREFRCIRLLTALISLGISVSRARDYVARALVDCSNIWYDDDGIAFVAVPRGLIP